MNLRIFALLVLSGSFLPLPRWHGSVESDPLPLKNMTERSKSFFYSWPIICDTIESVSKNQDNLYLLLPHCPGGQSYQELFKLNFLFKSFIDCCIMLSDGPRSLC